MAIFNPIILPLNIAEEASAIASASPAENTSKPALFASSVNSLTDSRPTAIKIVSHLKDFSVPGMRLNLLSICPIVTESTLSLPLAETIVWEV